MASLDGILRFGVNMSAPTIRRQRRFVGKSRRTSGTRKRTGSEPPRGFDGSYYAVDSNELSFNMPASRAFKDGMARARPTPRLLRTSVAEDMSAIDASCDDRFAEATLGLRSILSQPFGQPRRR